MVHDRERRELVERAKQRDNAAWEILYRSAYPTLLAYARRRLDAQPAEDAVSETMTRAIASIDRFSWRGVSFDGWLFGIHRHVVIDAQRAAGRAGLTELGEMPSSDPAALDVLVHEHETAAMRAAFQQLDPADQEVLELRVIARLSAEEVAKVMGKRAGAIRMAQSRALDRLRKLIEGKPA